MWFKQSNLRIFTIYMQMSVTHFLITLWEAVFLLTTSFENISETIFWKLHLELTFSYINQYQLLAKSWSFQSWLNISKQHAFFTCQKHVKPKPMKMTGEEGEDTN